MVGTRRSPLPLGGLTQAGRQALDRCEDPRVTSLRRVMTYYSRMSAAHSRAKHNCRRGAAMEWLMVGIRAAAMAWRGGTAVRAAATARAEREVGWSEAGHEGISWGGVGVGGVDGGYMQWRFRIGYTHGRFQSAVSNGGFKNQYNLENQDEPSRLSERRAKSWCCESRSSTPRNLRWSHASLSSARRKPPCRRARGRHPCTRRR